MSAKLRITATLDEDAVEAGRRAVAEGRAENLSAWINEAAHRHAEHDRRLRAMDEFIAEYEREHGEITEEDMEAAERWAEGRTVVIESAWSPYDSLTND